MKVWCRTENEVPQTYISQGPPITTHVSLRIFNPNFPHSSLSNAYTIRKQSMLLYRSPEDCSRITQEIRREPRGLENVRGKS